MTKTYPPRPHQELSPAQLLVVSEACRGKSNSEISESLGVTEKTVKFHLTNIYKLLDVKSRSQLIIKILREEVTDDELRRFKKILLEA